jgi:hypothetical protein
MIMPQHLPDFEQRRRLPLNVHYSPDHYLSAFFQPDKEVTKHSVRSFISDLLEHHLSPFVQLSALL